ncbi:serine protease [Fusarium agapanthi]|uniref:Serine protease n=1 Tax=Fusarium agapanthi TaxID=1803897 RepID=A0A9P5BNF7_9HYPO|nr:serine protease [Fusarium agapanthi]
MWNLHSLRDEDKTPYCDNETMVSKQPPHLDEIQHPRLERYGRHGTALAAVAAGYNNGILSPAWRANLVSVKVKYKPKGGGRLFQILQAISDVIAEHKKHWESPPDGWRGSVINVSMGFPDHAADPAFQRAWESAKVAGIPIAAAVGNSGENGSTSRPDGILPTVLNYFAPGVRVPTVDALARRPTPGDGTSLAAPLVAGVMTIMVVGYKDAWNIPDGKNIYARLDANLVPLAQMGENMTEAGVEPNLLNTGFFNPDRDFSRHPYAGIPWTEPPEIDPGSFLDKRQGNSYDNQRGDYWDKNYYDCPQHTVEFAGAQPTFDEPLPEEDLDKGYFDSDEDSCDCKPR